MKSFISLFIGLLFLNQSADCQPGKDGLIKIKSDFINRRPVMMTELFSEFKYVPLETNQNCLLGNMGILTFGKDILIMSHDERMDLYRFSDQGKFLNKIGSRGRGPTEYMNICDIELVGDTVLIASNFSNDIICYSLSGTFLKKYHLNFSVRPRCIVKLPDNYFMVSVNNGNEIGRLLRTDKAFNIKNSFMKSRPLLDNPLPNSFYKSKNNIFFFNNLIDTIFDVSQGFPVPAIILDNGKYNKPAGLFSNPKTRSADAMNYPVIGICEISDNFIIIDVMFSLKEMRDIIFYRISDARTIHLSRLLNDIDDKNKEAIDYGGFLTQNDYYIFILQPLTIIERFNNMTAGEKSEIRNSEFVKMASKITPESNPVLMVCKLK